MVAVAPPQVDTAVQVGPELRVIDVVAVAYPGAQPVLVGARVDIVHDGVVGPNEEDALDVPGKGRRGGDRNVAGVHERDPPVRAVPGARGRVDDP